MRGEACGGNNHHGSGERCARYAAVGIKVVDVRSGHVGCALAVGIGEETKHLSVQGNVVLPSEFDFLQLLHVAFKAAEVVVGHGVDAPFAVGESEVELGAAGLHLRRGSAVGTVVLFEREFVLCDFMFFHQVAFGIEEQHPQAVDALDGIARGARFQCRGECRVAHGERHIGMTFGNITLAPVVEFVFASCSQYHGCKHDKCDIYFVAECFHLV